MPRTTSCAGCSKIFSAPKYRRSHLSQTTNPLCEPERRAFLARNLPGYTPPTSPQQPASPAPSPIQSSPDPQPNPLDPEPSDLEDGDYDIEEVLDFDSDSDSDPDLDDSNDEHGRFLSTDEVTDLQGETWGEIHTKVYSGGNAGAIHSYGIPTMKELDNTLGGPPSNPYSPFSSRTDWELAKWAKLRGPSATAFTELMGVTGVCSHPLH